MNKKQIILIGGGGHCKSCIDVVESTGEYEIGGVIDVKEKLGEKILDYKVIGNDDDLKELKKHYRYALISVGQIKSAKLRIKLFNLAKNLGFSLPSIVASTAYVSNYSKLGKGTIIMHHAMINADVEIGEDCIINTKVLIEHDCKVGNHCHISTKSVLNGNVNIGNECFIGSNSTCVNDLFITDNVIIGVDSLVYKDLNEPGVYIGSPVKIKL